MTNHAAEAQAALDILAGIWGEDLAVDEVLAGAQVHATLALAEQQRIANVIALHNCGAMSVFHGAKPASELFYSYNLRPDVAAAIRAENQGE